MGKVLSIDDSAFWRDIVARTVSHDGHAVVSAEDALTGLSLLESEHIDLVILDVDMPTFGGLSFLEHIRRHARWKLLPVIMLTGRMDRDHILRAKALGAAEYLLKANFSLKELLERVRRRFALAADDGKGESVTSSQETSLTPTTGLSGHAAA